MLTDTLFIHSTMYIFYEGGRSMKFLKILFVTLATFLTAALGVLFILQKNKQRGYIGIFGEDEVDY